MLGVSYGSLSANRLKAADVAGRHSLPGLACLHVWLLDDQQPNLLHIVHGLVCGVYGVAFHALAFRKLS
jgi:hypothetical protein